MANLPPLNTTAAAEGSEEGRMSFFDHLSELRKRLVYSMLAIAGGTLAGLRFSNNVYAWLSRPMMNALRENHLEQRLIYTSPTGAVNMYIKVALYLGIVIASPIVLYQVWLFIAPGLYRTERRAVSTFIFSSVGLFLSGIAFCYYILLPYTLNFLIGFNTADFTPFISVNEYWDFVLILMLGLGLVFQLPILIFFLALFGIVTPRFLWRNFRYAVLIISVVAAIVTPTPDALTMLVFMAPMVGLYLLSILVAAVVVRRKRRAEAAAGQGAA
jgi:sec-independent protein translocase protein TatC